MLDPHLVRDQLAAEGLTVLHVAAGREPDTLTVYLHGPAGDQAHGEALRVCLLVPGVVEAVESELSPTIILLRTE